MGIAWPGLAHAASSDGAVLSLAWAIPFIGILGSIAILPLLIPRFWHRHFGKIALAWALAFVVPYAMVFGVGEAGHRIVHAALLEYLPFVILLLALYTVSGGIGVFGRLHGSPGVNTALLALGAMLANVMGTTGAAMVLVRPLIRANADRRYNVHTLVFFIFVVANAGGSLTPLGDPPLFLGFLQGVSFFWTTQAMLGPMLVLCGSLLAIYFVLDTVLYRKAHEAPPPRAAAADEGLRVRGTLNILLLMAIVGAVLVSGLWRPGVAFTVLGTPVALQDLARDGALLLITMVSLTRTPKSIHDANDFNWGPMQEVAKLFAAIFVTLVPVIAILKAGEAGALGSLTRLVTKASGAPDDAMFFWLTGLLSALLDNAPTYLVFFNLAGGDAVTLMAHRDTLRAISGGAVFMGALSYIGNAPNFMVRAIAVDRGIRMPSFFGYMLWSCGILLPLFVLLTVLFFR